jgi:hypothetical protein
MQPGGFGGGQGNGYPPGGFPPGAGAPGYPGQPLAAPQQQYGAPQQQYGAPQQQYGAPQQQYGAPQPGAPQTAYGPPPQGQQQYPGMAPAQHGAPPGYGGPGMMPGAPQMQAGVGIPGGMQMQMPGAMVGAPQGNSFGHAQSALKGAGGMMTAMKWGFVAIGALCVLGGLAMIFTVDVVTGISLAFTGGVFVVVALLVLPRFSGMLGQATAMVDGFAAKEQLAQTGMPAMGRLVSVQQTGRLVNYNPEIVAVVEVHHPQLGPYQTQTTAIVPQIAIPRAQPGAQVQVRVSPQNQHEIALVF